MFVEGEESGKIKGRIYRELQRRLLRTSALRRLPYYRLSDVDMLNKILPPLSDSIKVEEGETLSSTLRKNTYGGLVGQLQQTYVYKDDINYQETLKTQLNNVFKTCMNMVSSVPPTQPVETYTTAIQTSIGEAS